jgi:hypothetical protein
MSMKHVFFIFALMVVLSSCGNEKKQSATTEQDIVKTESAPKTSEFSQQDSIKATARQILISLRDQNFTELTKYFSSNGVLFSPYGHIDTARSKKLTGEDLIAAIHNKWVLTWGGYDGTGEPIKLTVQAYLKKFVYNADYLNAEAVGFNEILKQGNSLINLKEIYPNRPFIEYHFSGFDQKLQGMDWTSLRFVFEKQDGEYVLVAMIHDQWTI